MIDLKYLLDTPEIIGSIIGVFGVYLVTRLQINKMQEQLDFEKDKDKYKNLPLLHFSKIEVGFYYDNCSSLDGSLSIHNMDNSSKLFNLTLFSMTKNNFILENDCCVHILNQKSSKDIHPGLGKDNITFEKNIDKDDAFAFGICSAISKNIILITYIVGSKVSGGKPNEYFFGEAFTLYLEKKEKWEIINPINKDYIENEQTTYKTIIQLAEEYRSRLN